MSRRIRLLVLDVDGVLTDGTVQLLPTGEEIRTVHFRDLDAVAKIRRRGVTVAILSGEDTPSSRRVAERFGITEASWGSKDKLTGIKELTQRLGVELSQTCYVGDSDRDAPAIEVAGVGLAPQDGTDLATRTADHVLPIAGGRGVVGLAVTLLENTCDLPSLEGSH